MSSKYKTKISKTVETAIAPVAPDLSVITPSLHALAVSIDSLKLDTHNARKHGDKNRTAIRNSLQKFGQQKPISVDADGVVLAGNGTLAEAKALGWTHIAVARSHLRGVSARAFAIADNRTSELSTWDSEELTAQLEEIAAADVGVSIDDLGFNEKEIDALLNDVTGAGETSDKIGRPSRGAARADRGGGDAPSKPKITITCNDETQQEELLGEFQERGLDVKSLPSL